MSDHAIPANIEPPAALQVESPPTSPAAMGGGRNEYLRSGLTLSGPVGNLHPPFYHGHLTKDTCFGVLQHHPIGTFLLRPSSDHTAEYTLSVRTNSGVLNMRVYRRKPGMDYYLDAPEPYRHYCTTMAELILFYQSSDKGIAPLDEEGNIGGDRFHILYPLPFTGNNPPNRSHSLQHQAALQLI